jgi:hypothetical protein
MGAEAQKSRGGRPSWEPTAAERGQVRAMAGYGIPEAEIALVLGVAPKTLRKHCRDELDTGTPRANAKVGEFLFTRASGHGPDERANVTAAIFWLKTRGGWKETMVSEVTGKDGGPVEVSDVSDRVQRKIARIAAAMAMQKDTGKAG